VWWPVRFKVQISGFDRVIRLTRSISILKNIQNDVILVLKKKVNGLQPGFAGSPGQPAGSHRVMAFLFFHQPGPIPILN
jgi:hypothetical protein